MTSFGEDSKEKMYGKCLAQYLAPESSNTETPHQVFSTYYVLRSVLGILKLSPSTLSTTLRGRDHCLPHLRKSNREGNQYASQLRSKQNRIQTQGQSPVLNHYIHPPVLNKCSSYHHSYQPHPPTPPSTPPWPSWLSLTFGLRMSQLACAFACRLPSWCKFFQKQLVFANLRLSLPLVSASCAYTHKRAYTHTHTHIHI